MTYAFAVHFNAVFLAYCGALGLASYALVALASELEDVRTWFDARVPNRLIGGFEIACASAFALLWLSQIIPAILSGTAPAGLTEVGLLTNPAHVLDLSFVLPAMFAGGWLLWHRRPAGYAIASILLGFGVLMGASLAGMATALYAARLAADLALVIGFGVFALVGAALLAWMFHDMTPAPTTRAFVHLEAV
jgi:hypothetical protein